MDFVAKTKQYFEQKVSSKVFSDNCQLTIKHSPEPIVGGVKFHFLITFTTHFTLLDITYRRV